MNDLTGYGVLTLLCGHPELMESMLPRIRQMEPNTPLTVILEDIDEIIDKHGERSILSMLDGENQIANVVYVATTNYPERLGARIVNRPSRFDERIFVGMPSALNRKLYLQTVVPEMSESMMEAWVRDTTGFSIGLLRELVAAAFCLDQPYEEVLARLRSMFEKTHFLVN